MTGLFRVVDTGVREGRFNIAVDQAMIELHQAGRIPDTFRFMRFPPTALIGRHQALSQEIDVPHCRAHGIGIVRRITGGGAIYLDEGQLGWGLVFHRSALGPGSLAELARDICLAVAAGLRQLGVEARYRPRNDIEVDGRKISGTGGFFDGDTLIYQGTVLVDMDPAAMVAALRVPRAKLEKRQLDSAAQRVVTLRELLGPATPGLPAIQQALLEAFAERFDVDWSARGPRCGGGGARVAPPPRGDRHRRVRRRDRRPGAATRDFAAGTHTGPGGTITSYLRLEGPARARIGQVLITGDFFVAPPRTVLDLEAALRGAYVDGRRPRSSSASSPSAAIGALTVGPGRLPRLARARGRGRRRARMKTLAVIQHTSAEYLGLIEDHLEGRRIRFRYSRPFTAGGRVPKAGALLDGLVLLGGGPWGSAGGRNVPTLIEELTLTKAALEKGLPVLGIGLGAQILVDHGGRLGAADRPRVRGRARQRVSTRTRWTASCRSATRWSSTVGTGRVPPPDAPILAGDAGGPSGAVPGRRERARLHRAPGRQGGDRRGPDHGIRGGARGSRADAGAPARGADRARGRAGADHDRRGPDPAADGVTAAKATRIVSGAQFN